MSYKVKTRAGNLGRTVAAEPQGHLVITLQLDFRASMEPAAFRDSATQGEMGLVDFPEEGEVRAIQADKGALGEMLVISMQ